MTYPQGYIPPAEKPKPRSTQSDSLPLSQDKIGDWYDKTTMDDHLNDFEKEKYTDTHFKKQKRYSIEKPFRLGMTYSNKKHGFFKRLMIKLKMAEEINK